MAKRKPPTGCKTAQPVKPAKPAKTSGVKQARANKTAAVKESAAAEAATGFPIVGVGASAGGLDALKQLFGPMPAEPGLAFVVIQHLDPTKDSLTPELLNNHTTLHVTQVEDDPHVVANRVYVIPPNKYLSISKGTLHLSAPNEPRGTRMAVDYFLRSLAEDQQQRSVAIILSGTGTDGSLGVKAVKSQGGLVIAQDPETAAHAGMPRSAVATGTVDYVLPIDQMPDALVRFAQHPYVRGAALENLEEASLEKEPSQDATAASTPSADEEVEAPDDLSSILALLKSRTQIDFQSYKDKTLIRRTNRRMCLHHLNDYSEYLKFLRNDFREGGDEVDALVRDLLITVTDFFRDKDAWNVLEQLVLPRIVAGKNEGDVIRVWTPGCATGEEPYSIAMLLMEALSAAMLDCPLQIFASDIEGDVLEVARKGRYPRSIEADVSRRRLRRFFTQEKDDGHHYFVTKTLREAVVFAEQNLIADAPFSKLDLVCCRNLLIYLKPEIQEKIISLFHFALAEGGYLFLGNSETIGRHSDLFETVDKRWRFFRKTGQTPREQVQIPIVAGAKPGRIVETQQERVRHVETRITQLAQHLLLDLLSPSAVVIDRDWRILYISGDVDGYLTHSPGVPKDDLLQKCRRGLRNKLRGAVQQALEEERTVTLPARVLRDGKYHDVRLVIRPFHARDVERPLALVVFETIKTTRGETTKGEAPKPSSLSDEEPVETDIDGDAVIRQLEDELAATKEDLQQTTEQGETSQEELKAANEEVMSVNEELQSTNEELETSKEELESLNEELSTVNQQLAGKVEELETKHADLENLIAATDVATICLDAENRIRWFTPAATRLFRIGSTDHGRPISDFAHDFPDGDLPRIARQVFNKLSPVEAEVEASDRRHYLRRVTPYRSDDHRINGVVITFVDITSRKRWEEQLHEAKQLSDTIIDSVLLPVLALDSDLRVKRANAAFYEKFRVSPESTEGELVYDLGNRQWDIPQLRELLERMLPAQEEINGFEVEHEFEGIGRRTMRLNARRMDHPETILLAMEDVTAQKAAERTAQQLNESLEEQVNERVLTLSILQDVAIASNKAQTVEEAIQATLRRICDYNHWVLGHAYRRDENDHGNVVSAGVWYTNANHVKDTKQLKLLEEFQINCTRTRISHGDGLIGRVFDTGEPLWIDDVADSDDWRRDDPGNLGLGASIVFPIRFNGEVVAVLECLSDEPINRESRFMEIMENVGIQLGHVVERNRLEKRVAEATEREQRRLGSDIHDGIGQELGGLRYLAQSHADALAEQSSPDHEIAERIAAGLGTIQQQLRSIIRNLVPVEVDGMGLAAALQSLAERTVDLHGVDCVFEEAEAIAIEDNSLATQLYRISQEAVINAVRHARADRIVIQLLERDRRLVLKIIDDGVGIDPNATHDDGFGLRSMAHRARLVGGHCDVAALEGGTTVECSIPRHASFNQDIH